MGKQPGVGASAEQANLSLAAFIRLVQDLDLGLEKEQLRLVFQHMDQDQGNDISFDELSTFVGKHFIKDTMLDIAECLAARHNGNISEAFAIADIALLGPPTPSGGARPSRASISFDPASAQPDASAEQKPMSE